MNEDNIEVDNATPVASHQKALGLITKLLYSTRGIHNLHNKHHQYYQWLTITP
jgi:hypothetical protein